MAMRNILQLLAAAALAPAVAGADGACAGTDAMCAAAAADETSLLQARGNWRHKRKPGQSSVGDIGKDQPEFDPAEGGDDEVEQEYEEDEVADVGDGDMCAVNAWTKYFGYNGPLRVKGKMWLRTVRNRQDFTFRLHGVDPACENGPGPSPNSCGIYLHVGTSCLADAGDHLYNREILASNPWAGMTYTAVKSATGSVYAGGNRVPVLTGLSKHDVSGHVIVVHDFSGKRVACTTTRGFFSGHPPSTNTLPALGVQFGRSSQVQGTVSFEDKPGETTSDTGVYLSATLHGVDDNCDEGAGPARMSCTVSISTARSCSGRAAHGEDFFHAQARKTSPWTAATYAAYEREGAVEAAITHLPVNLGFYGHELLGYTFVVRDFNGKQIGCGTIGGASYVAPSGR